MSQSDSSAASAAKKDRKIANMEKELANLKANKPKKGAGKPKNQNQKPKGLSSGKSEAAGAVSSGVAVSYSHKLITRPAKLTRTKSSLIVDNCELLDAGVLSSTGFFLDVNIPINPGLLDFFPYLATQANEFAQYRFKRLEIHYVPFCGTNTAGEVYLIPCYDPTMPVPANETLASSFVGTVVDSCWAKSSVVFNQQALAGIGPRRYIRNGAVPGDLRGYDCGKIFVFTNNFVDNNSACGKVYIDYECELFEPVLPNPTTSPVNGLQAELTVPLTLANSTNYACLNGWQVDDGLNPLGLLISTSSYASASNDLWSLPRGVYQIIWTITTLETGWTTAQYSANQMRIWFVNTGQSTQVDYHEQSYNASGARITYVYSTMVTVQNTGGDYNFNFLVSQQFSAGAFIVESSRVICRPL